MINSDDDEWGNLELPGFGDDKLLSPNINKILANRLTAQNPEWLEKMRKKHSDQSKLKMSIIQKQVCKNRRPTHMFDPAIQKKAHDSQRGIARPQTSAKLKGKPSPLKGLERPDLSAKLKGKPKSEEHKTNMQKPKSKHECPHCHILVAPNMLHRYHMDNCKHKV
jgi:hypothetical protein